MQAIRVLMLAALALLVGAVMLTVGCFNYQNDCQYSLECLASTGTGGDGGPPPGCDPTQTADPVGDNCGIFVSPAGDDKNTGSKLLPLKTLGAAVKMGGTIYACAGTTPYSEAVSIEKPVTLFGGLDCTKWAASAGHKSQLTAAAGMVPLSLSAKATGTAIHDFAVTSADATAPGASSIAIVDDSASVTLDNVDVSAGKGAPGTPGAAPPAQVMTPASAKGGDGVDDASCNVTGTLGGNPGTNMCDGVATNGGVGGQGIVATPGSPGTGGQPMSTPSNGGIGQTASLACTAGQPGAMGALGTSGSGAKGLGDVSTSGYQGPVAMMGASAGGPGQGGGGGGAAHQCMNMTAAGPSGGGGGAGGCGGQPGAPGTSGGSSIGILAFGATLTMKGVTITTHAGGDGGVGGDGQTGGDGGLPGHALGAAACDGGKGGQGGNGGGGGGGAGGHSIGIAVKGGVVPDLKGATVSHGVGGNGASGGNMDAGFTAKGDTGLGCKTLDFGNPMSPTACVM